MGKRSKTMKTYIIYVEDCTPSYKEFKTFSKAEKWELEFRRKNQTEDSWIDFIITGKLHFKPANMTRG